MLKLLNKAAGGGAGLGGRVMFDRDVLIHSLLFHPNESVTCGLCNDSTQHIPFPPS